MKGCELCPGTARMYCESDQASLCFDCDAKVHCANFLVARHSRSLLCRSCQSPTPWKAAGPRLVPTVSLCDRCVTGRKISGESGGGDDGEADSSVRERVEDEDNGDDDRDVDDDADGDEEEEEEEEMEGDQQGEDEEEEEEEGEEQVVPWTAEAPPVASSSSSEEESVGRMGNGWLKRMRGDNNVDPPSSSCSQDQLPCSSSPRPSHLPNRTAHLNPVRTVEDDDGTSSSFRPLKDRKKASLITSCSQQLPFNPVSFGSGRPPI